MALSRFIKGGGKEEQPKPVAEDTSSSAPGGLASLLSQGITLPKDREDLLKEGFKKGLEFFEDFNESRLRLAFTSFDADMRKALFEVIFLIHVNDPKFTNLKYTAVDLEHKGGMVRPKPREAEADLFVEGAPHGVEGIEELSPIFKEAFQTHIRETYDMEVPAGSAFGYCPIKSVHSLGSIGTVGHKSRASDLDLQVQYELEPFHFDTTQWNDRTLREALSNEVRFWMNRFRAQQKIPASSLKDPQIKANLQKQAYQQVGKTFPNLFRYLIQKQGDYSSELTRDQGLRGKTLHEIIQMMKRSAKVARGEELKKQENLLLQRLKRIQDFIASKYPLAEIYLFACSNDDYRIGHHGSTLVSKEASGSAYELILNYETLMPGIQITPMVPTHFIFPQPVNDDPTFYERTIDYIRFGLIDYYDQVKNRLVNLGPTPDLDLEYMGKHSGAVYWEAFKASSGNLPKAILNLFRIEMLIDERFLKTIIQTIKEPDFMHQYASEKPQDEIGELEQMVAGKHGIPPWALIDLEGEFPLLKQDPWWLRFKALKIAYHEENGAKGIEPAERARISNVIDMSFALHVRISDVFTKPGDTRSLDSFREKVLTEFLKRAFPPISERRKFLEHLFIGEVHSVNMFERDLRDLFKNSLNRVNSKIVEMNIQGETNQKEFEIWYHYYQENFEPAKNVIEKTILKHLTVPRVRIQIGVEPKEGWFFKSLQKESKVGKRFDTFGHLDHLPEEVMLRDNSKFLGGLAELVLNGYYGIMNEGTLKETATLIEFDAKKMDLGNRIDNTMAFIRPDNVHSIINKIISVFEYKPYHYMDCINDKREVTEVIVCLNLCKFGRISFLYRDNLQTWYCDEVDHQELFANAPNLHQSPKAFFTAKPLHMTLAKFFKVRGVNLNRARLDTWINPNSLATNHSSSQLSLKEKELSQALIAIVNQVHRPKEDPPENSDEEQEQSQDAAKSEDAPAQVQDHPPAEE